tara:strand:- start:1378 stop:1575 length:198 start_codon:yes stop_codon:yes gene_type:complete
MKYTVQVEVKGYLNVEVEADSVSDAIASINKDRMDEVPPQEVKDSISEWFELIVYDDQLKQVWSI